MLQVFENSRFQKPVHACNHPIAKSTADHAITKLRDCIIKLAVDHGPAKGFKERVSNLGRPTVEQSNFCCLQSPPHSLSMHPVLSSLSFLLSHSRTSATFLPRLARKQISVIAVYLLTQQDAPIRLLLGSPSQTVSRDWKMQSDSSVAKDLYPSIFSQPPLILNRVCGPGCVQDTLTLFNRTWG